jgi:hypothetical protein
MLLAPLDVSSALKGSFASIPGTEHTLTGLLEFWGKINSENSKDSIIQVCLEIVDIPKLLHFYTEYMAGLKRGKPNSREEVAPPSNTPPKTASSTKWEEITIRFINGDDVDIIISGKTQRSDFKAMGFENKKTRLPNNQWKLLRDLSESQGEISWRGLPQRQSTNRSRTEQDFGATTNQENAGEIGQGFSYRMLADKTKKRKQLLAETLQSYFSISEDPFLPYKTAKGYKIRLKLISPS